MLGWPSAPPENAVSVTLLIEVVSVNVVEFPADPAGLAFMVILLLPVSSVTLLTALFVALLHRYVVLVPEAGALIAPKRLCRASGVVYPDLPFHLTLPGRVGNGL